QAQQAAERLGELDGGDALGGRADSAGGAAHAAGPRLGTTCSSSSPSRSPARSVDAARTPLASNMDAAAATSIMTVAAENTTTSPSWNGCASSEGKNCCPVRVATSRWGSWAS